MINELYSILSGFTQTGTEVVPVHGDIQEPGRGTSIRVLLDSVGQVEAAELLKPEDFADIWTIGNGNKNQFPCAKLVFPTRPGGNEHYEAWRKENKNASEAQLLDFIATLRDQTEVELPEKETCWPNYRKKIFERANQLSELKNGSAEPVFDLYNRYLKAEQEGLSVLTGIDLALWNACQKTPNKELLKASAAVMFGEGLKKGLFPDGKRITLILDFKPDPNGPFYASSRRYVSAISTILNESAKLKVKDGFCPISGESAELLDDKFPRVKLPVIGNTNLYSRYDGSGNLSVLRHGNARSDAYSVSAELAAKLGAVLTRLTDPKNNKITWDSVPSETGGPDLLLSFCRDFKEVETTYLFTGEASETLKQKVKRVKSEKGYLAQCQRVFEQFQKDSLPVNAIVDIVVLRKINDGNQKVVYSTTASKKLLEKSTEAWSDGCGNTPPIMLSVKFEKEEKALFPWTISPKSFVYSSSQMHVRGGEDSLKVQGIPFAEVMKLFLLEKEPEYQLTTSILSKLVSQFGPLLERVARSKIQSYLKRKALVTVDFKKNADALIAVSMLGLILFKRKRYKEHYMEDLAFRVGQLLSATNELHLGYCFGVRGGQIPNTLLGDQCYGMALQSPVKALALMANRIKPYLSWARNESQKFKSKEKPNDEERVIGNGIWAYRWYLNNEQELTVLLRDFVRANKKIDDQFKAELMLGYLNGRPFTKTNKEDSQEQKTKEGVK